MKTIEQVLEGVTAGGKWQASSGGYTLKTKENAFLAVFYDVPHNAAYAARACSNFPALVKALQNLYEETGEYIELNNLGDPHHNQSMKDARAALAEALKD